MAYATFADVQARSFQDLSDNEALVTVRLGDAEMLIKSRIKDLEAQVLAGTISLEEIVYVECEMLLRLVKNPESYVQESDGGYSYMLNQALASGNLEVSSDEWKLLGAGGGAFTLRPYVIIPGSAADQGV